MGIFFGQEGNGLCKVYGYVTLFKQEMIEESGSGIYIPETDQEFCITGKEDQ